MWFQNKLHSFFLVIVVDISHLLNRILLLIVKYLMVHIYDYIVAETYLYLPQVNINYYISLFIDFFLALANEKDCFGREDDNVGAIFDNPICEFLSTSPCLWVDMVSDHGEANNRLFLLWGIFPILFVSRCDVDELEYFARLVEVDLDLIPRVYSSHAFAPDRFHKCQAFVQPVYYLLNIRLLSLFFIVL